MTIGVRWIRRLIAVAVVAAGLAGARLFTFEPVPAVASADAARPPAAPLDPAGFARDVAPFLQKHCVECHGPTKQSSGIRYDGLAGFTVDQRHLWTLVHEQISSGDMPPEDKPRPTDVEKTAVLTWITKQQQATRISGTRRLNRRELSMALRDVTGLNADFSLGLPDDGRVGGFDTGADGLQDSADSVAQIMTVTRRAVDGIRFLEPPTAPPLAADLVKAKDNRDAFDKWKTRNAQGGGDTVGKPGFGMLIRPKWVGDRGGMNFRIVLPENDRLGIVRIKAVVSVGKFVAGVPNPRLWVDVGGRELDFPEISNPYDKPRTLEYEVHLGDVAVGNKGLEIVLCNRVEMPYAIDGFPNDDRSKPEDKIPGGTGLFRPVYDQKALKPEQMPVPYVVIHSIEIDADHRVAWPPAEWKVDVGTIGDNPDSARRLLALWMDRAWRRPTTTAEQARFFALYESFRGQKLSFDEALRATFQSVLMSGSLRYLTSPGDLDASAAQYATASRLSFMLWSAPPDAELRKLAADGKLREPSVLDAQVDRLLSDPRSDAFLNAFVTQWLEMGQPITLAMEHIQKQDFRFGRHLKQSMRDETVAYIRQTLTENRPATELLSSDWTMMNDILARHYGYPALEGGQLRKVTLKKDDPRGGGILSHAGIQSMLCWMGENWVIYRGAWAMRHILDNPPPPPPLEVPELIPSDGKNHGKSFRQLLQQHQEDPKCSICHKHMDLLGFAFQNFDLSGRWRDVEHEKYATAELDGKIEWRGVGKTRPVDAAGQLPRGETFKTYAECKQLLVKNYAGDLVRGLMKNYVLYGTGATADVADMAEIRAILAEQQKRGYPMRDVLKSVIRSNAWLYN